MSILVIGANGGVGQHLVEQLKEKDIDFTAGVRKESQVEQLKEKNIKATLIDVETDDIQALTEKFKGFDRVVFSVGSGGSTGADKTIIVDLDGAIKAIKASEANHVKQFVMVSTYDSRREAFDASGDLKPYTIAKHYADEYLKQASVSYTIVHPGVLLNDENIKWLNDNNISMVLSLDGRKEVHDYMRPDVGGHGTYDKVVKNFKKLVDSRDGNNYYLRGTFTNRNMDFSKDVLSMADEGFDILSVEPVVLKDSPYGFTKEDLPKIFAEYDKLTEIYLKRKKEGKGFFFFHFNIDLEHGPCVAKRLSGCGAGHEYYAVAADGNMYPCHQFAGRENYMLGNVFEGVKNKELPKEFRKTHVLSKEKCRDCWAKFFCSGGCHANADLFHGNIHEPYELGCELQKKRCECAIVVKTAEKFGL